MINFNEWYVSRGTRHFTNRKARLGCLKYHASQIYCRLFLGFAPEHRVESAWRRYRRLSQAYLECK